MYHLEGLQPRLHRENDLLGLLFNKDGGSRQYVLRILTAEYPNNLLNFSIGSANALASAGTGWETVDDSNGKEYLEPEYASQINQCFVGVAPSYARIYRQYPSGQERGSLIGTRAIGDQVGYVDGRYSPLRNPNPNTEFFVVKGQFPAFNGYHPQAEPASITIYANFYVASFNVEELNPANLSPADRARVRRITIGGRTLMTAPGWLMFGEPTRAAGPTTGPI